MFNYFVEIIIIMIILILVVSCLHSGDNFLTTAIKLLFRHVSRTALRFQSKMNKSPEFMKNMSGILKFNQRLRTNGALEEKFIPGWKVYQIRRAMCCYEKFCVVFWLVCLNGKTQDQLVIPRLFASRIGPVRQSRIECCEASNLPSVLPDSKMRVSLFDVFDFEFNFL